MLRKRKNQFEKILIFVHILYFNYLGIVYFIKLWSRRKTLIISNLSVTVVSSVVVNSNEFYCVN